MSRRKARAVRWVAHAFATTIAFAVIATLITLPFLLLAVRFAGLSAYVVQGARAGSSLPIGSLVLVADTAWVAVPTLGYAVTYAESYSPPIITGLIIWIVSVFAMRTLAPYMTHARGRLTV